MRHYPDRARDTSFPLLHAHWQSSAEERQRDQAEINHFNALSHSMMDTALDRVGKRWPVDWTDAEKLEASSRNAAAIGAL